MRIYIPYARQVDETPVDALDQRSPTLNEAFSLFMRKSVEVGGLPFDLLPESAPTLSDRKTLRLDPSEAEQ